MKPIFLLIAIVFLPLTGSAQNFHFSDTSNKWKVYDYDPTSVFPGIFEYYAYSGLTTFSGATYNRMDSSLIREDTGAKKVYVVARGLMGYHDTSESLLYNFNLALGDTLVTRFAKHYVSAMDTVQVDGVVRKIWTLTGFWKDTSAVVGMFLNNYQVLDRVGCLSQPLFPYYPFTFEDVHVLVCFQNYGRMPVLSHALSASFDNSGSCDRSFGVGVHDIRANKQTIKIMPDPVSDASKMVFPGTISAGRVLIRNLSGQIVYHCPIDNASELLIGDKVLQPGFYFYQVTDATTGDYFTGKFVRELCAKNF